MKWFSLLVFVFLIAPALHAQNKRDSLKTFPVIQSYPYGGVFAVRGRTFKPDPGLKYKIVIDLTVGPKNVEDSTGFRDVNWGFGEVGRRLNLHVADDIPRQNIDIVVAVHGSALFSMLNNEAYNKKYGIDNPSLTLIDELKKAGIKFVVCGQAMHFMNVSQEQLIAGSTVGLTAQTVLTSYQAMGYSLQQISPED